MTVSLFCLSLPASQIHAGMWGRIKSICGEKEGSELLYGVLRTDDGVFSRSHGTPDCSLSPRYQTARTDSQTARPLKVASWRGRMLPLLDCCRLAVGASSPSLWKNLHGFSNLPSPKSSSCQACPLPQSPHIDDEQPVALTSSETSHSGRCPLRVSRSYLCYLDQPELG